MRPSHPRFHLTPRSLPVALVLVLVLTLLAGGPALGLTAWVPLGPEGGTIFALASAPSDGNLVYAATAGGGVFASRDDGLTWQGPGGGLTGDGLFPSALAVDPRVPTTAYAAAPDGIWKTASGGDFWVRFQAPAPGPYAGVSGVLALAVDPLHSTIVYAGTVKGVFRSDNGGRRWAARNTGLPAGARVLALDIDPGNTAHLIAAVEWSDSQAGLFRSLDGAATWTRLTGAPAADFTRLARVSHTLFGVGSGQLFRSDDGGTTWISLPRAPASLPGRIESLAVSPHGAVYVQVRRRIEVSSDLGESFSPLPTLPVGPVLAMDAGGALLVGTQDLGVLRPSGLTFVTSNGGLIATAVRGLEVDPNDPRHLYAAVLGGGLFESRDRGLTWLPHNDDLSTTFPGQPTPLEPQALALAPNAPSRLFLGIFRGVAASTDAGLSWRYAAITDCTTPDLLAVTPSGRDIYSRFPMSPTCGPLICDGLASHDFGKTWSCLPKIFRLDAALVDPTNAATVYLAGDSTLYKSVDGGKSVTLAGAGLGPGPVLALAESPAAPRVIYAGEEFGGVRKSRDGAAHWAPTGPGLPLNSVAALAVDPADAQRVYAGAAGAGVFVSRDGGASWQPLGDGLPGTVFTGPLRLSTHGPRILYAGTDGAGVWALTLP